MVKIANLTLLQIVAAIGIGLVASFAIGAMLAPHPVEQKTIVITPVPTPAPVYIQPTPQPTLQPEINGIVMLLPLLVVMIGVITVVFGAFAIRD